MNQLNFFERSVNLVAYNIISHCNIVKLIKLLAGIYLTMTSIAVYGQVKTYVLTATHVTQQIDIKSNEVVQVLFYNHIGNFTFIVNGVADMLGLSEDPINNRGSDVDRLKLPIIAGPATMIVRLDDAFGGKQGIFTTKTTVQSDAAGGPVAPVITTQPASLTVNAGINVTMSVDANGTAPLSYQWRKDGVNVPGATSASLTLGNAQISDAGNYTVVITNAYGSVTSNVTVLTVTAPAIAPNNDLFTNRIPIVGANVCTNSSNQLAGKEVGEPNHADNYGGHSVWWTWTAPSSGIVRIATVGSSFDTLLAIYTGSTVSALTLVAADDEGGTNSTSVVTFNATAETIYQIAVDGWQGAVGNILLNLSPGVATAPYYITPPSQDTRTNYVGSTLKLESYASGNAPLFYQWRRDGVEVPGATNRTFKLVNLQTNQSGNYSVVVSNAVGTITNGVALLRVLPNLGNAPVSIAGQTYDFYITADSRPEAIGTSFATVFDETTFAMPARGGYPAEFGTYTYTKDSPSNVTLFTVTTNLPAVGHQLTFFVAFQTLDSGAFNYVSSVGGLPDENGSGVFTNIVATVPTITSSSTGKTLTLFWPKTATGYRVESVLSLSPPTLWSNVAGSFQTNGSLISIVLPITGGQTFNRLVKP